MKININNTKINEEEIKVSLKINVFFDILIRAGILRLSKKNKKEYNLNNFKIDKEPIKIDIPKPNTSSKTNNNSNEDLNIKQMKLPNIMNDSNVYYDIKNAEKETDKDLDEIVLEIKTSTNKENTEINNSLMSINSESETVTKIKSTKKREKYKRLKSLKWILTFNGIICKTKEDKKELFEKVQKRILSRGFLIKKFLVVDDGKSTYNYIKLNKPFNYNKVSKTTMFNLNKIHPRIQTTFNHNKLLPYCREQSQIYTNFDVFSVKNQYLKRRNKSK